MKPLTDAEFLIWLSQRVKFKYNDHSEISDRLEKISEELVRNERTLEEICSKDYSEVERLFR